MKRFLFLIWLLVWVVVKAVGQDRVIVLHQAAQLKADAGNDLTITTGQACRLGNNPTASGGTGAYIYRWEPSNAVNNSTLPNPLTLPVRTTTYTVYVVDESHCAAMDEITVFVQGSGIDYAGNTLSVKIYPNPTDRTFYFEASNCPGKCIFQVFNTLGQEVLFRSIDSSGNLTENFDLTGQRPGLYYVRMINQNNLVIKPVILN